MIRHSFHDDPVVVVHDDFPPEDRHRVERAAGDLEIRWLEVPEADRSRFPGAEIEELRTAEDIAASAAVESLAEVEDEWDPFEEE